MQAFTRWVLGPVWQGILLSVLFYLIPYGTLLGIVISLLVTLRQGMVKGLVVGLSSAVIGVFIRFLLGGIFVELNFDLLTQSLYWTMLLLMPAWCFAALLRQIVSLSSTMQIMTLFFIGVFGLCFYGQINLFPKALNNPMNEYVGRLTLKLVESQNQSVVDGAAAADTLITPENIEVMNRCFIHLFEVVTLYSTFMLLVMLARSWQSYVFMPNEFSREFRSMRTGNVVVAFLALTWALDMFIKSELYSYFFGGVLFIASIWLFLTGITFFHWLTQEYKLTWKTMLIFYLALFVPVLSSLLFVLLVLIGLVDGFVDLRGFVLRSRGPKTQL